MRSFIRFISYNNAVPIAVFLIFGMSGAALAATPQVRDAVVSSQQQVRSVDNSFLLSADIPNWDFKLQITDVTEDTDYYYVTYTYQTIALVNYVWQETPATGSLTLSKKEVEGQDLGIFVAKQLLQVISSQSDFLTQAQQDERAKGESLKVVATVYSGLIGHFLSESDKTFAGYVPVVQEEDSSQAAAVADAGNSSSGGSGSSGSGSGSTLLSLQVFGNDPARLSLNESYIDLGAVLLCPSDPNLGYQTYVNGVEEENPVIDTSTSTAYTIEYRATDPQGNVVTARRIVLVGDAADPGDEIAIAGSVTQTSAASEVSSTTQSTPATTAPDTTAQTSDTGSSNTPDTSASTTSADTASTDTSSDSTATSTSVDQTSTTTPSLDTNVAPDATSTSSDATSTPTDTSSPIDAASSTPTDDSTSSIQ